MKRFLLVILAIHLLFMNYALSDRFVDAADCENIESFFEAIEMGTTITTNGFIYSGPFAYEMDNIKGYRVGIYIDIPGCISRNIFLIASEEQTIDLMAGDYVTLSGQMFSRGNTGNNYYFNTQIENGYLEKLEAPEPDILDLNSETVSMAKLVSDYRLNDIARGNKLKIVLTDEWTNSFSSKGETTYYCFLSAGDLVVRFHTKNKDLFKGDIIDFEGTIYDYDEEHRILYCRDPIYSINNVD